MLGQSKQNSLLGSWGLTLRYQRSEVPLLLVSLGIWPWYVPVGIQHLAQVYFLCWFINTFLLWSLVFICRQSWVKLSVSTFSIEKLELYPQGLWSPIDFYFSCKSYIKYKLFSDMSYINILGSLFVCSKQSKFCIIERNNLQ